MIKKILIGLGVVIVVLIATVAAIFYNTFAGLLPLQDGEHLGRTHAVLDSYVAIHIVKGGEGQAVLIDAGNDPAGTALLAGLERRGLSADDVKAVFLTHGHPDHTAGAHLFENATIYGHANEVDLAGGKSAARGPMTKYLVNGKPAMVGETIAHLQEVTIGDVAVRAFHVPGHTAGSMVYLVDGVLFFGDSAGATADRELRGAPWVFTDDQEQNRASLAALAQTIAHEGYEVSNLVFSHTGSLEGVAALNNFASASR